MNQSTNPLDRTKGKLLIKKVCVSELGVCILPALQYVLYVHYH